MLSHQTFIEKGRCKKCHREIIIAEYAMDYERNKKEYFFKAKGREKIICGFCDPEKGLMSP